jgi:hypothetical protein
MRTTPKNLRVLLFAALGLGALSPRASEASADSPSAIGAATKAALAVRASVSIFRLPTPTDTLRTEPGPAKRGFIKEDLLETAIELVNEGVRFNRTPGDGSLTGALAPAPLTRRRG